MAFRFLIIYVTRNVNLIFLSLMISVIILGWISRRWDVVIWTRLGWPRIGTGGGSL